MPQQGTIQFIDSGIIARYGGRWFYTVESFWQRRRSLNILNLSTLRSLFKSEQAYVQFVQMLKDDVDAAGVANLIHNGEVIACLVSMRIVEREIMAAVARRIGPENSVGGTTQDVEDARQPGQTESAATAVPEAMPPAALAPDSAPEPPSGTLSDESPVDPRA